MLEQEREGGSLRVFGGILDFKNRLVGFAIAGMHAPLGFIFTIHGLRRGNGGAFVMIGGGGCE